jgi:hypothetical protein
MECHPKNMSYSPKQHLFLVVFELSGPNGVVHEVVLYWEQTDIQTVNSKGSSIRGLCPSACILLIYLVGSLRNFRPDFLTTASYCSLLGRDAAFLGPDDNQYAILEEDRTSLNLFNLKAVATKEALENNAAVLEENTFADNAANSSERQGPLQFIFESEVDRIFSSPLGRLNQLFSSHPSSVFSSKKKGGDVPCLKFVICMKCWRIIADQ